MQCFKCLNKYSNPKTYFDHLKETHELRGKGQYRCTLCAEILNEFGKYKKHVEVCLPKYPPQNELENNAYVEAYNDCEMEDVDIAAFKDKVKTSALKLALNMNANMSTTRSLAYETIGQFQTFIDTIVEG